MMEKTEAAVMEHAMPHFRPLASNWAMHFDRLAMMGKENRAVRAAHC
jgi:hypothetical protein